jgi:PIN domain nuclease of toxin-antitoxin system
MDILDASALICLLKKEKGYREVSELLKSSKNKKESVFINQINYTEVVYFLLGKYGESKTLQTIAKLKFPFLGISNYMDSDLALYASTLKSRHTLSLGDAVGLAFTKIMNGRFWTKDKALAPIAEKENINLKLIG